MYKLTIVSGPNRGSSYAIQEGENSVGRQSGNSVVLSSSRVSKRHCVLVVEGGKVTLRDEGSSNGTFINGVMAKQKEIAPGDRISIGEFVLELSLASVRAGTAPGVHGFGGNVVPLPGFGGGFEKLPAIRQSGTGVNAYPALGSAAPDLFAQGAAAPGMPGAAPALAPVPNIEAAPADLKGKLLWFLEKRLMPALYGWSFKTEWRLVCATLIGAALVAGVVLSVTPVIEQGQHKLVQELGRRALFTAKLIGDRNAPVLQSGDETKTKVPEFPPYTGTNVAALVDLDSRVLASNIQIPGGYLTQGAEGRIAVLAAKAYRNGKLHGPQIRASDSLVVAVQPVEIYSQQLARNVIVAMAVVSINAGLFTFNAGDTGVMYGQALVTLAVVLGLVLLILYRLTLKPFLVLNDDIDKVLKGDLPEVTHEFKLEELNPLWDVINSALQRVPKSSAPGSGFGSIQSGGVDEMLAAMRLMGESARFGVLVCDGDRKALYLNSLFEDATGIRSDNALGQDLPSLARDQAFGALATELFERAQSGGEPVGEDFDFSGVAYRVQVAAIGPMGLAPKGYVMSVVRNEG